MKIVTKHGGVLFDAKYDAWGNQKVVKNDIGFIRGYTGHEEMPEFGLINMNARQYDPMHGLNLYDYSARQYDPAIGQFTSMDPLCERRYL